MLKIYVRNGYASIATRSHFNKIEILTEEISENIFIIFNLNKLTTFFYDIFSEEDVENVEVEWTAKNLSDNIKSIPRSLCFAVNKDIQGIIFINNEKVIFNNIYPDEISTKNLTIEEVIFS